MAEGHAHWSRIGESGSVLGMKTLLLIHRLLGRWAFRVVLMPVMLYFFLVNRHARQASRQYLSHMAAFNANWATLDSPGNCFRHFMTFGEILLDKLLVWMGDIDASQVDFANPEAFAAVEKSRKGGLIVVSHLGNIEVCSALAHRLPGLKLTILVYTQHARKFNSLLSRISSNRSVELLQVSDMTPATAMMLAERIEAGELVVIAGDRTPVTGPQRTCEVSFLGEGALFPQGPVILGGLLKCPMHLMFCLKERGRYRIYLESFAEQMRLPRKGRDQYVHQQVQRYAAALERYCQIEPLQWFNFFSFWDKPSAANTQPRPEALREL